MRPLSRTYPCDAKTCPALRGSMIGPLPCLTCQVSNGSTQSAPPTEGLHDGA